MRPLVGAILSLCIHGADASPIRWHESLSPHFLVYHQSAFMPSGFLLELGKLHGRLRRDLAMFSPWMAKERIKIYLYSTPQDYVAGEFHPPAWSNGVAYYDRKLVATHEQSKKTKLLSVLAHEMSHLLFEGYWAQERMHPPVWLNEGLAMMEEASDSKRPELSEWHQGLWVLTQGTPIPFSDFFEISPTKDLANAKQQTVSLWYVQAYSIVYFLYRKHSRIQFRNFCKQLREGKTLQQALWKAYRFSSVKKLEQEWRKWLLLPEVQDKIRPRRSSDASASAPAPGSVGRNRKLKNVGFNNFQFHRLMPE